MRSTILGFAFIFLFTFSLLAQSKVKISGIVKNSDYTKVDLLHVLSKSVQSTSPIDKNGKFKLHVEVEKSDFYMLQFGENDFVFLVIEPKDKIKVEINGEDLENPKISGSENSALFYQTKNEMEKFAAKKEKIQMEYMKVMQDEKTFLYDFFTRNSTSLSTLFFIDNLDDEDASIYTKLINSLADAHPENPYVTQLKADLKRDEALAVGTRAPEISLPNPDGEVLNLSDYKGKVVLIDFWASWCSPCRIESPQMVKLYKNYKDKGFEIFGVSLDKDKNAWTKAIEKDKLEWVHVSDLLFWKSEAAKSYNINSIPFTVLIDKDGVIIAKGLRSKELEEKLAEIFN